jgi:hypothetical protein
MPAMLNANCSCFKWSIVTLILVAEVVFAGPVYGQSAPSIRVGGVEITGVPDDWTHHHVIFANPGTEQDAIQSGHYAQWQKIVNEPRYVIQQLKKGLPIQGPAAVDAEYRAQWIAQVSAARTPLALQIGVPAIDEGPRSRRPIVGARTPLLPLSGIDRDWSMTSGGTGGLAPGHYPAKYSFLLTTASKSTESCSDYVAFPTGIQGSSTQATLIDTTIFIRPPAVRQSPAFFFPSTRAAWQVLRRCSLLMEPRWLLSNPRPRRASL